MIDQSVILLRWSISSKVWKFATVVPRSTESIVAVQTYLKTK